LPISTRGREKEERSVYNEVVAARVSEAVANVCDNPTACYAHRAVIHAARPWLWPGLVLAMLPSTRPMGEVLVDPGLAPGRLSNWRLVSSRPKSFN
jgi:hypothetical protein